MAPPRRKGAAEAANPPEGPRAVHCFGCSFALSGCERKICGFACPFPLGHPANPSRPVSYTHLRAHETLMNL
eukprot:1189361-Prymnesium_polylepis.1